MGWFRKVSFKIKTYIRWGKKFIGHDLWKINLDELSKAKARFLRDLKVVIDALRNFSDEKIGFQSVALSYFCTMAAVPLVAVAFAITSGFGLEKQLQEALYAADINQTLIDTLMSGADNIIKAARPTGRAALRCCRVYFLMARKALMASLQMASAWSRHW